MNILIFSYSFLRRPSKAEIAAALQKKLTTISSEEIAAYAKANKISMGEALLELKKQRQKKANTATDSITSEGKQRTELHVKRRKR